MTATKMKPAARTLAPMKCYLLAFVELPDGTLAVVSADDLPADRQVADLGGGVTRVYQDTPGWDGPEEDAVPPPVGAFVAALERHEAALEEQGRGA